MRKVELYENHTGDKYAVLVSPCYGAGWSTWGWDELAYDKRVVEFFLSHVSDVNFMRTVDDPEKPAYKDARDFFMSLGYEECPYMGGFSQIEIAWVPYGTLWRIAEYDGNEYLETLGDAGFKCFNKPKEDAE